ncbi:unnamed protein product, partial [Brenthis ino]
MKIYIIAYILPAIFAASVVKNGVKESVIGFSIKDFYVNGVNKENTSNINQEEEMLIANIKNNMMANNESLFPEDLISHAALTGDGCPIGYAKINGKCAEIDY